MEFQPIRRELDRGIGGNIDKVGGGNVLEEGRLREEWVQWEDNVELFFEPMKMMNKYYNHTLN